MKVEMVMPQMGESIAEATVLKWLKNVGDPVQKDETILEISTDKVDSEIPSPAAGIIAEIRAAVGETVPVKSVIAIIETEKGAAVQPAAQKAAPAKPAAPPPKPAAEALPPRLAAVPSPPGSAPVQQIDRRRKGFVSPTAEVVTEDGVGIAEIPAHVGEKFYSPVVRNLAHEYHLSPVELGNIPGSGTHGRVTKGDVLSYVQHRELPAGGEAQKSSAHPAAAPRPAYFADGTRVEAMDNMRKRIAEHMVRSKATSPHVYTVAEVDLTNITKWREKQQKAFQTREGFKLSFTPFFLEAAVKALVEFPYVNASVDGDNIVLKKAVNLGCAVALGTTGLIVPVIKNADQLNLAGIARALNDLANRARTKKLQPDETQGGTFTVTNPGIFGSIIGYPIINQPQLGILGVGAIKKRPVVIGEMIAIRDIVYLTLSYDHRVVDGSMGGQFLNFIARYLEEWDTERQL
jgi:2-oxoglutarate dehydrogenase E2 component (dihydrolipoamide succinyltransferase)